MRTGKFCLSIFLFLVLSLPKANAVKDSLGILALNGERFIVYKVDLGQSFYYVSKRFHISMEDIKKANGDTLKELKYEQLILIPVKKKEVKRCEKKYVVNKGESIYSIARSFNISADDIKNWNHLKGAELKENDTIILYVEGSCKNIEKVNKKGNRDKNRKEKRNAELKKAEIKKADSTGNEEKTVKTGNDEKNVKWGNEGKVKKVSIEDFQEEGAGTWIDNGSSSDNVALHGSAPVGTVIRVVNIMNGKCISVKVVGRLPEKNEKMNQIIIINKHAADYLNIKDKNFRVKLYYTKSTAASE